MDNELKQYLDDQFQSLRSDFREDLREQRESLTSVLAGKSDVLEIKEIVERLDRRTEEDVKAVIKDVERIKLILKQQGMSL